MRTRKICFFLGAFWLLFICTILSGSIERQMTVKVQVLEPNPSMLEIDAPMQSYSSEILSDGNLYDAVEGTEWESGLRAEIIPPEFYITEGNKILLIPGGMNEIILYRTKELFPGAVVQKTMPYVGKEGYYLTLSPKEEPQFFSMIGKEPYMENLHKEELELLPEERLYSMTELENFSKMFLHLGILIVLLTGTLLLWIYSWKLTKDVKKHRTPLFVNGGVLALLLLGIYKLTEAIHLPSSLLPRENILDFGHYGETFGKILNALRHLQLSGNVQAGEILNSFQQNLWLGCSVIILGIFLCVTFIIIENRIIKKNNLTSHSY